MNTGHGIALAGLFIGMGLCIHAGAYFGANWLLLLYIGGWLFVGKVEQLKASSSSKKKVESPYGVHAAESDASVGQSRSSS